MHALRNHRQRLGEDHAGAKAFAERAARIDPTLVSALFDLGLNLLVVVAFLLGSGGSILTVPILVYAIGQPVQLATTTSLVPLPLA